MKLPNQIAHNSHKVDRKDYLRKTARVKTTEQEIICAGNGCKNLAIFRLTIVYLNKIGWFCESYKNDFIQEGLIMENETSDALVKCQMRAAPCKTNYSTLKPNN